MTINPIISYIIFSTLSISMISGLFVSSGIIILLTVLMSFSFFSCRNDYSLLHLNSNSISILLFISWCLFSLIWTVDLKSSVAAFIKFFLFLMSFLVIKPNLSKLKHDKYILNGLVVGLLSGVFLFYIESFSNGIITKTFKAFFEHDKDSHFNLFRLDRGCTLLSISFWAVAGYGLNRKKYLLCGATYVLIFVMLISSDSLASLVGFTLASMIFILARFISVKFLRLATIAIIIGSMAMPVFSHLFPVKRLADSYDFLPDSAKHRLFIWNYVAHKIPNNPIIGVGIGASKTIKIPDNDLVTYRNYRWSPLPLHPHNNILQIFFELGAIGLAIYILIVYQILSKIENLAKVESNYWIGAYSGFVNYYIICMISYSVWQSWWMAVSVWILIVFQSIYFTTIKKNDN